MDSFGNIFKTKLAEALISFFSGAALICFVAFFPPVLPYALILLALAFSYAWPKLLILKHPISISAIIGSISAISIVLQTFFTQLGTLTWQIYIFVLAFMIAVIDELFINKNKNPMSAIIYTFFGSIIAVSLAGWVSLLQLAPSAKAFALFALIILLPVSFFPLLESKIFERLNYQHSNYARFIILGILVLASCLASFFIINAFYGSIVGSAAAFSWKLSALISAVIFTVFVVKMVLFSDIHIKGSLFAKALFPIMILGMLIYICLTIFAR
jgi:hypothetical protein